MKELQQEVFNKVKNHLLTQNARCVEYGRRCAYRGKGGLSCAIGCLITDNYYDPMIEGDSIRAWSVRDAVAGSLGIPISDCECLFDLLNRLQYTHDKTDVSLWPKAFKEIAEEYNLDYGT